MEPEHWSKKVTETSHSLDIEKGLFTWSCPKKIAAALWDSALKSSERKGSVYQSAMSMLNFYINRAGCHLPQEQKEVLLDAKRELKLLAKVKNERK